MDDLDVRLPIGLMFSLFGVLLAVYGLVSDPQIYEEHSLGINVNLGWGVVLLVFGATMLGLALRARRRHLGVSKPSRHGMAL
jgi:hypothetical protein